MAETRPELAETAAVADVLAIAESVRAPVYFVHQSTPAAVDLVVQARRRGILAFTESVAHHLVLDDGVYAGPTPERFVCFRFDGRQGLYIHPNIWHEGVFGLRGTQRFFDEQGAVHARVSVDFAREFGCLLEAPIPS